MDKLHEMIGRLGDEKQEEPELSDKNTQSQEVRLVDTRNILRARLQRCTSSWDSRNSFEKIPSLDKYWDSAYRIAKQWHPESVECLKLLQPLLQKYRRFQLAVQKPKFDDEEAKIGLNAFLSSAHIQDLRHMYEYGDSNAVEEALDFYFEGLPSFRRKALVDEFLAFKPRRSVRDVPNPLQQDDSEADELDPEELKPEWLAWQTPRHKNLISKMIIGKADKWEIMNEIGDQFYHLRKEIREQYKSNLQEYCIRNVQNLIGQENFNVIRSMYLDTDHIEQLETKFNELVAELPEERQRLLADHYAVFCRKIFRLVNFEPADLTIWLTSAQKMALGQMIQNPNVNDTQIYDKMYEFYMNTTGEQKEEAGDIIESGCRHFIAHMFGDDNAEELEELRLANTVSRQHLAARLATWAREVSDEMDRKRAEGSLSICSRIYLAYDGSCECNGHANECDGMGHECLNCTDNTYGVQCELCMESFTGNPLEGGCVPIEGEETSCTCNGHSEQCDSEGKCQSCLHNTVGDSCERCAPGFHGDATTGTRDDCTRCPCPDGGDCFINEQQLVECVKCPAGKHGITCAEDTAAPKDDASKVSQEETNEKKLNESMKEEGNEGKLIEVGQHQESSNSSIEDNSINERDE
ncbi:hypothetical protein GCK32_007955 [Trichostrongylus colubriformis]|uniref:Laminin EGF-like domain-containing protein n=1 Tax=Trichostrongylus colubriformis TaxID=6319 RepID=A0AAN8FMI5_TRICO